MMDGTSDRTRCPPVGRRLLGTRGPSSVPRLRVCIADEIALAIRAAENGDAFISVDGDAPELHLADEHARETRRPLALEFFVGRVLTAQGIDEGVAPPGGLVNIGPGLDLGLALKDLLDELNEMLVA